MIDANVNPKVCLCGWKRPITAGFSKDELGIIQLEIPEKKFYFLYDCPQCGARWNMLLERID